MGNYSVVWVSVCQEHDYWMAAGEATYDVALSRKQSKHFCAFCRKPCVPLWTTIYDSDDLELPGYFSVN